MVLRSEEDFDDHTWMSAGYYCSHDYGLVLYLHQLQVIKDQTQSKGYVSSQNKGRGSRKREAQ